MPRTDASDRTTVIDLGSERRTVDGVVCTWQIHVYPDGRLASATLAEPHTLAGFELVAGDSFDLAEDGRPQWIRFAEARTVRDVADVKLVQLDEAGAPERLVVGDALLDLRGVVRQRHLRDRTEWIADVPCTGIVAFDEEGRPERVTLGAELPTRHGRLPAGSYLELAPDGTPRTAQLASACILGGRDFAAHERVSFEGEAPRKLEGGWTFYTPYA